jgi:CubicO group peptidase (beta-lactamase class C family)
MTKPVHLISFLCVILIYSCYFSSDQTRLIPSRITKVENNLIAKVDIVFADSVVKKYNIYDRMKFYKIPSVSIALINNGRIEWTKAYGFADLNEKKKANTSTVFQAASLSKSVNAFCIMKLVQDGKLSLNKDIRQYLKSWRFPDNDYSNKKTINIKNLLSHTAGLSTSGFMGYSKGDTIPTINEILEGKRPANSEIVKPIFAPNTQFKYSGGGVTLSRKILDDNVSPNYDSLLQKVVFGPLGMTESTFTQPLDPRRTNFATAYDGQMQELKGKYYIYPEQAPDGLWTTATDLAKFIISIQQSFENQPKSFLSNSIVKEMLTPVLDSTDAALGVFI